MPTTKDGLQKMLEFFLYGMMRASDALGNTPLFLRSIEEEGLRKFMGVNMPRFHATDDAVQACRAYTAEVDAEGLFDAPATSFRKGPGKCPAMETKKIPTCVDGLDDVLGGGIPAGHVVLVSGLPGTMKSTLTFAILHGNARDHGARALYVSLEQTRKRLEAQMAALGFDLDATRGAVHILDVGSIQKELGRSATKPWMEFLRRTLETKKEIDGIDLVVLDSLKALEVLAKFEDRRSALFGFFEWARC